VLFGACGGGPAAPVPTFSGSAVGLEADVLRRQLARFEADHAPLRVELRSTPDAADDRHQLYVQWLNARAEDPDLLQLDVIWTLEFAAAGWIRPLTGFEADAAGFFPATIAANRWQGTLFALPWFVDVGMLYWRRDLIASAPATLDELGESAARAVAAGQVPFGLVWQGARYEGLVTTFLEHLGAFGGRILDPSGAVVVDAEPGVRALTFMRDAIHRRRIVPTAVLTWQEEQVRFAFQNGQALYMRNWPYAYRLLQSGDSRVTGRVAVAAMPATASGAPTAALGGSQLAINRFTDLPEAAAQLVKFLTEPEQMIERARSRPAPVQAVAVHRRARRQSGNGCPRRAPHRRASGTPPRDAHL
jgi:multiple sugar transport system substrate-binding protein